MNLSFRYQTSFSLHCFFFFDVKFRGRRVRARLSRTLRVQHLFNRAGDVGGVAADDEFEAVA